MAYTPMFDKVINTKPDRELCLKFLEFLKEKGLVQGDVNPEETVAEFFDIDLEQAEDERKMLVREFHESVAANLHTASEALARMGRQKERREKKNAENAENAESGCQEEEKELGKKAGKKVDAEEAAEPAGQKTAKGIETETEAETVKLNSHRRAGKPPASGTRERSSRYHGVNAKIKAHILDDAKMREIGFTDYAKDRWYFCRGLNINFNGTKKKRGLNNVDISFSVTIPKDGSDIRIDVLDELFCQPYDYQYILGKDPGHKIANIVKEQVEYWMEKLQEVGVLEGHVRGEYI